MINFKAVYIGSDDRIITINDFISGLNPFLYQEKFNIKIYSIEESLIDSDVFKNPFCYSLILRKSQSDNIFFKRLSPTVNIEEKLKEQEIIVRILNKFVLHSMQFMSTFNTSFLTSYVDIFILNEIQEYKNNQNIGLFLNKLLEEESSNGYDIDDVVEKYIMKNEDRKRTLIHLYERELNLVKLLLDSNFFEAKSYLNSILTEDSK
jgi:hypothetical protein